MEGDSTSSSSYAFADDVERASMEPEIYYNDGSGPEETDAERIARGDLRWSDAKGSAPLRNAFMAGEMSLDRLLMDYTITQKTLNKICAAYIFSWIADWSCFFTYIVFVFISKMVFNIEHEESDFAGTVWKINAGILISGQFVFYLTRMLSIVVFLVLSLVTLYICIFERKAYRFFPPKE